MPDPLPAPAPPTLGTSQWRGALAALALGSLALRLWGLGWGMPQYDPAQLTHSVARHSYHLDEDRFFWPLMQMRPAAGNFDVQDYHWGTLQFYLVYAAQVGGEVLGLLPTPWESAFLAGDAQALPRMYLLGRLVSVAFGVVGTLLVAGLAALLRGRVAGLAAGVAYAIAPLAVVEAHYLTNDISASVLMLGAVAAAVWAAQRGNTGWLGRAGVLLGLATAAKYSAAAAAPALLVAQWIVWRDGARATTPGAAADPPQSKSQNLPLSAAQGPKSKIALLVLPWLGVLVGFTLGEPYGALLPDNLLHGLQQAAQANATDWSAGLLGPLKMIVWQARNLAGLGLTWPLALLALLGLAVILDFRFWILDFRFGRAAFLRGNDQSKIQNLKSKIILAALAGLAVSLLFNRVYMLRYSQPLLPLLAVLAGLGWAAIPWRRVRWAAGGLAVLAAGGITLGQLALLSGPHPANDLLAWFNSRLQPGQQVARLWPEYPPLDDQRNPLLRIDPWQPDLPPDAHPAYIVIDDMRLGPLSARLTTLLAQDYQPVAQFGAQPHIGPFTWDEGPTPHDWKYSHPTFTVYARRP